MCGIVGMIGKENVTESLIQGLTKLEYRVMILLGFV